MRKPTHRELLAFGRNLAEQLKTSGGKPFQIDPEMLPHYIRAANYLLLQSVRAHARMWKPPPRKDTP